MSLVVQILRPKTKTAAQKSPSLSITSKISLALPPTKMEETAPKQNIKLLPMKKAITVVQKPVLASLAKRVKLGVAVPPETKEPTTRPAPLMMVKSPLLLANCSAMVPSPCAMAINMAAPPKIATQGTAI